MPVPERLAARSLRHRARLLVERLTGFRVFRRLPHGFDACNDILATGHAVRTVLDVGANIGQSAARFREAFPDAVIHSFEPARATHAALVANVRGLDIESHRVALGREPGEAHLLVRANSSTSHLVDAAESGAVEAVGVTTVDAFVAERAIRSVDLLKVDVEGHDLEVLAGAEAALRGGRIAFVLVEAGLATEGRHVALAAFREHLAPHGLHLLGLYDQTREWDDPRRLRYVNALFARSTA